MSQQSQNLDFPSTASSSSKWESFWFDAFAIQGSITPHVLPNVLTVGVVASLICALAALTQKYLGVRLSLELTPYEFIGTALGLLLVLRTNAGYDRWWEARKLWGGIVNQSRNITISALAYGPHDQAWREKFVRLAASFPHAARLILRGQNSSKELNALLGQQTASQILDTRHPPSTISLNLGLLLKEALEKGDMDSFAYMQIDRERAQLIDHIGACERILKTPLAQAYSIKIRRFIALFVLTLPFALLHSLDNFFLVPLVTMLVAYPLFSLDQLGVELQNPFNVHNLSHLPLDEISMTIEKNLLSLLAERENSAEVSSVAQ